MRPEVVLVVGEGGRVNGLVEGPMQDWADPVVGVGQADLPETRVVAVLVQATEKGRLLFGAEDNSSGGVDVGYHLEVGDAVTPNSVRIVVWAESMIAARVAALGMPPEESTDTATR
jgi:hypothetical protein